MPPIIECQSVSYRAGKRLILDAIDWSVHPGEHWAILGPNGSGKSTLLKIACGYLWPLPGGKVLRLGEQLVDLRALRLSIGWVTCSLIPHIPRHEPALDTVLSGKFAQFGLKRLLMTEEELSKTAIASAQQEMATIGITHLADAPFGVLSQGEQQLVLLARARMALPLLVVLDEPCAGLDPGARERYLAQLQSIATQANGPGMILVTHHLEEIMPAFDQTLVLQGGRVLATGETTAIVDPPMMETLYGVRPSEIILRNGRMWPIW